MGLGHRLEGLRIWHLWKRSDIQHFRQNLKRLRPALALAHLLVDESLHLVSRHAPVLLVLNGGCHLPCALAQFNVIHRIYLVEVYAQVLMDLLGGNRLAIGRKARQGHVHKCGVFPVSVVGAVSASSSTSPMPSGRSWTGRGVLGGHNSPQKERPLGEAMRSSVRTTLFQNASAELGP